MYKISIILLIVITCQANNMQNAFIKIFLNNTWGSKESVSGPGSTLAQTAILREKIKDLFYELNIQTILDAACGDFNWFKEINYPLTQYIGIDIVPQLIANNNKRYKNSTRTFELKNLVTDELPQVDLIICRDCFVHLAVVDIKTALRNFKKSGSTYVLMTTFTRQRPNTDVPHYGDWVTINFEMPPFNLPKPLLYLNEGYHHASFADKSLGLWKLTDIEI